LTTLIYYAIDEIDKLITSIGIREADKLASEDAGIEIFVV
jgi:hypothetical protein